MDTIKGYIDHFVYQNNENGYTVMEVITHDGSITCVGTVRGYGEGEDVEIEGEYVIHPVYNRQLKISAMRSVAPEDTTAIIRYLGSGAIKGIGEAMARKIVDVFGEDTFRVAQEEPEALAKVKGISLKKAYDIGAQIAEKRDLRDAMIFLQGYGISVNLSNKIYKKYGMRLYAILKENPYKLSEDIEGVGFATTDEIASKVGIAYDSDYRIRCGILHTLLKASEEGHVYLPENILTENASELLGVDKDLILPQIGNMAIERKIILKKTDEETAVYASSYYYEEQAVAVKLCELAKSYDDDSFDESRNSILERIKETENRMNISLDMLQRDAVCDCLKNGVFILTGGPGTGKTTTINMILAMLEAYGKEFVLAAPTGRAAKRIEETTGYEAKTIHRLLEVGGQMSEEPGNAFFDRNEDNPLETDAVIIDETSMVDIHLFKALVKAVAPGTKLILVGDASQLHSVGPGQVLKDIMGCGCFPCVCLEKIFRQDKEGHIVSYAYDINHGKQIDFKEKYRDFFLLEKEEADVIYKYINQLMAVNVPKEFGIRPLDVQVLSPMKKGRLGTICLNEELQKLLNPPSRDKNEYMHGDTLYREGDKVMQTKNDYDMEWEVLGKYNLAQDSGKGIYNGDLGTIVSINEFAKTMTVRFDDNKTVYYPFENLDELELAYAVTIHKSQGSEYPVVIIPLLGGPSMLFTRNLLYTAVTRARECVIILGSSTVVNEMIQNDVVQKRYTSLSDRIKECMGAKFEDN